MMAQGMHGPINEAYKIARRRGKACPAVYMVWDVERGRGAVLRIYMYIVELDALI